MKMQQKPPASKAPKATKTLKNQRKHRFATSKANPLSKRKKPVSRASKAGKRLRDSLALSRGHKDKSHRPDGSGKTDSIYTVKSTAIERHDPDGSPVENRCHTSPVENRCHTFCIERVAQPSPVRRSTRTADVAFQYGLPLEPGPLTIVPKTSVPIGQGRIVLFVGPSGSGKSSALAAVKRICPGSQLVHQVCFRPDRAIIDEVAATLPLGEALSLLSSCALGEAHLWLRRFQELSEGEQFRARLARAVGLTHRRSSTTPLLCDEFCSSVHRRAAKALSYNLRKLVSRKKLSVVLASNNEDVVADLQPDTVVRFESCGRCEIHHDSPRPKAFSLRRRLRIERGCKGDYDVFASMHYRKCDDLGFVDKVFVMREKSCDQLLGIVVYAYGPLELRLRNRATNKRFCRRPDLLNRHCRILRRLVIHPDIRGCGLGHYLVSKTLPLVGTEYVECLAAMGAVNPVFEKAGMKRIGQCELSQNRIEAVKELQAMGVDPFARDFAVAVCRKPKVRRIVTRVVHSWYQATTAGGESRVCKQSPQLLAQTFRGMIGNRPVYYLWQRKSKNNDE